MRQDKTKTTDLALRDFFGVPKGYARFFDQPVDALRNFGHLDVSLGKKDITVKTDIPGMQEKDIHIQIKDGVLSITGESKDEKETMQKGLYRFESESQAFSRNLVLPKEADEKKLASSFKNGKLEITIPRKGSAKP